MIDRESEVSTLNVDITDCQGVQVALELLLEGSGGEDLSDKEHAQQFRTAVSTLLYVLRDKLVSAQNSIHALQFGKYSSDDPRSKVKATPQ